MIPLILSAAAAVLVLLLFSEKRKSFAGRLIFKPLLSSLFIWTALLQPAFSKEYTAYVLAALVLSWIGDVLLMFRSRPLFLGGLGAFLLGHVSYSLGFYRLGQWSGWIAAAVAALLILGGLVFQWLRPHLNGMRVPVAFYIIVITIMVGGALAVAGNSGLPAAARWCVPAGAVAFYLSDLFVARDQFVSAAFVNSLIGLPLYYAAQFALALSIGAVTP